MNQVILAVDGGATKTEITVRKRDGTILFSGTGEGSNYQTVGLEKVKEVLSSLLNQVKNAYPAMCVDIAVFALAGIDSRRDGTIVQGAVQEVCHSFQLKTGKLIIKNDAEATLFGVTENNPGALLIAGTGSIAYAHDAKGKVVRSGGWGHRAGDEGSGYWIGREVLQAIFRMEDGRGPMTSLKEEVLTMLGLDTVLAISEWLFSPHHSVDRIAKLSTVLDRCALNGDGEAIRISEEAVDELASLVGSVLRKCGLEDAACKIFINGGAIIHSDMRRHALEKHVQSEFPLCEIVISEKAPIEYVVVYGWIALDG